jgi:DNA replication protein DnaC
MTEKVKCPDCNNEGYVVVKDDEALGGERTERCACRYLVTVEARYKDLLPKRFRNVQWKDYVASDAIRGSVSKGESFWLWGPTGTGKTLLAVCKLKARIYHTIAIAREEGEFFFFCADEFFKRLNAQYDDEKARGDTEVFDFRWMSRSGYVVLDDLDKRKVSAERQDMLYRFFNEVWERALPCTITSNLSPLAFCKDFFKANTHRDASLSRILAHFEVLQCAGDDFRLKGRKK